MQRVLWLLLFLLVAFQFAQAELPKKIELAVPFLCQAPSGDWSQPWQDACEEAAIVMAIHFAKDSPLDKEAGKQEILGLVKYQNKRWGGHHDLTAKKAALLMREYYKYKNYRVIDNVSIEGIKQELSAGNIVLAPMAGRMLNNRYYRRPGPAYHYLVFIGYDEDRKEFITNDPGTKRGEHYRYKYDAALNAVHDWAGSKEAIAQGKKAMIVIYK
ncbi:MAG: C39 family peptidase [Candidatus Margulisiibacteriota bacterium]